MEIIFKIFLIAGFLILYFMPSYIANKRKHKKKMGVYALNFFSGFTGIGWVLALVWAICGDQNPDGFNIENMTLSQKIRAIIVALFIVSPAILIMIGMIF